MIITMPQIIPDDMLFYYLTPTGEVEYFSACYSVRKHIMNIEQISHKEFNSIVITYNLKPTIIKKKDFPYVYPDKYIGDITAYII